MNIQDEEDVVKNEAPILFGMSKKNVYQVPEDFFVRLQVKIEKGRLEQIQNQRKTRVIQFVRYVAAVAAVLVLIFLSSTILHKNAGTYKGIQDNADFIESQGVRKFYNIMDNDGQDG